MQGTMELKQIRSDAKETDKKSYRVATLTLQFEVNHKTKQYITELVDMQGVAVNVEILPQQEIMKEIVQQELGDVIKTGTIEGVSVV